MRLAWLTVAAPVVKAFVAGCEGIESIYCREARLTREVFPQKFQVVATNEQLVELAKGLLRDRLARLLDAGDEAFATIAHPQDRAEASYYYARDLIGAVRYNSEVAARRIRYASYRTSLTKPQLEEALKGTRAEIESLIAEYAKHVEAIHERKSSEAAREVKITQVECQDISKAM